MVRSGMAAAMLAGVLAIAPRASADPISSPVPAPSSEVPADSPTFEALLARYERTIELFRRLEEAEQALFERRATYYAELVAFTRELEAEHEEEEEHVFEEQFARSQRKRAFLKTLLERRSHERTEVPPCLADEPAEWYAPPRRYSRD